MKKSAFLTFCFSFGPGCGQMYQGYMRRGMSLLLWFSAVLFVSVFLGVGTLSIFTFAIWAFSFFDSFNLRALSPEQRALFPDDFIPSTSYIKKATGGKIYPKGKGGRLLGWLCVIVGALILYDNMARPLLDNLALVFPALGTFLYRLPAFIFAVAVIVLGIWLLTQNKKSQPEEYTPYDSAYTPPPAAPDTSSTEPALTWAPASPTAPAQEPAVATQEIFEPAAPAADIVLETAPEAEFTSATPDAEQGELHEAGVINNTEAPNHA